MYVTISSALGENNSKRLFGPYTAVHRIDTVHVHLFDDPTVMQRLLAMRTRSAAPFHKSKFRKNDAEPIMMQRDDNATCPVTY
jgi:hypothetical protein